MQKKRTIKWFVEGAIVLTILIVVSGVYNIAH